MLSLSDPKWRELKGANGYAYDASKVLTRMEAGEVVWDDLWSELQHQSSVGVASYAALPHIVRISEKASDRDWNLYALAATIEIERHRKGNPALPPWLVPSYKAAWDQLVTLALSDLSRKTDKYTLRSALAVVALGNCNLKLGALLGGSNDSELDSYLEDTLSWSEFYG